MLDLIKRLCAIDAPSGFEDDVRYFIRGYVEGVDCDITEDVMGNLIIHRRGRATQERVMFAAHMDEVGFMISSITDSGFLKLVPVGGIDTRVVVGKRVRIGAKRILGVIGTKAAHHTTPEERKVVPKVSELYIDIGAESKEQAEALTEIGDYAVFDSEPVEFGDGMLKARAIDDRVGCAIMLKLIRDCDIDAYYAFTVQEEVGTRGAGPVVYRVQPDVAIILEGTTAGDIPGTDAHKRVCAPCKGAVLPFMDNSAMYDRPLFNELIDIAKANGIGYQIKQYVSGGTDAGTIQRSREGVRVAAISAAVRYIHSPSCVASVQDFNDMYKLARAYLEKGSAL